MTSSNQVKDEGLALLGCPFCGAAGEEIGLNRPCEQSGWFIRCYGCGVETAEQYTEEEVVAAWNARALLPPAVGEGQQMVPIEPTEAMIQAPWIDRRPDSDQCLASWLEETADDEAMAAIYRAMIKAAPSALSVIKEVDRDG